MKVLEDFEQYPDSLASFTNLISNLCYGGSSKIKTYIMEDFHRYLPKIQLVIESKKKSRPFVLLKENIYNFFSNLLTDELVRK